MIRIHSFDVFDTVLTRTVCDPHAIFLIVGQTAIKLGHFSRSAAEFKKARIQAEIEARRQNVEGEITLKEIYDYMGKKLRLSCYTIQELQDIELKIESQSLRPIQSMAAKVAEARAKFSNVIFLSDMYLPSELLCRKLGEYGLLHKGDRLLVSGELGFSKASGKMFSRLLSNEGLRPNEICHWGDNAITDVAVPKNLGIDVKHFQRSAPNRYERILESFSEDTNGASSYLAGASRLVRLNRASVSPQEDALSDVAAGVAGPALLAYVIWILESARTKKLRRIYFLARDGQILLKIARLCAPYLNYEGELRYLFASRQSWRLPAIDAVDTRSLCWAFEDTDYLSTRSFLERVGLDPESLKFLLIKHGFTGMNWDQNLRRSDRQKLRTLASDPDFLDLVLSVSRSRREKLLAYLSEQGILDGNPYGIVDLGWHGSMQFSLEHLLETTSALKPVGFYFGLSKRAEDRQLDQAYAFFYDERHSECFKRNYWVEPMMEVFCAADHGLTLSFEQCNNQYIPILKTPLNDRAIAWGLPAMQSAILEFVKLTLGNASVALKPDAIKTSIHALFTEFWNAPTPDEATAWGSFSYADDQTESFQLEWAMPLRGYDWLRSVYRGSLTPPHNAGWASGSLCRSSQIIRGTLPHATKVGGWIRRKLSK